MNGRLLVAFVGALAVALIRCGSDDCTSRRSPGQLRVEHLQLVVVERDDGCDDVAGAPLCKAQCINQFSCSQINGADPAYTACLANCNGK